MKKVLINSFLAILFSITAFFVIISLMVLNDNFVINEVRKNNYYNEIYKKLENVLEKDYKEYQCFIDNDRLKENINRYIKKDYNIKKIEHSIECNKKMSDKKLNVLYRNAIEIEIFKDKNFTLFKYIIYGITLSIIIMVGSLLIKTKKYHDIYMIMIISFVIMVAIFGSIYLFVDFDVDIINIVINTANHYLLALAIILFEIGVFKKLKIKI